MKELFIPYTEALELKELGFNLPCFAIYDLEYKVKWSIDKPFFKNDAIGFTLAPLYTQAFKWFRDKYNLILDILPFYDEEQLPLSLTNKQKPKGYFIWDYNDNGIVIYGYGTAIESFYSLMDSLELDRSKNYLLIEKL